MSANSGQSSPSESLSPLFKPNLTRLARNLAKNWIRSEVYRRALINAYQKSPSAQVSTADPLRSTELYNQLLSTLDCITPKHREAIVLFYLEGFSVKEIAEIIDVTQSSAKKRLERGRKQLREQLEIEWKTDIEPKATQSQSVKNKILSGLLIGPAMPLTAYAAEGSLAAIPVTAQASASTSISQTMLNGVLLMSAKKSITVAATALLLAIALGTYFLVRPDSVPIANSDSADTELLLAKTQTPEALAPIEDSAEQLEESTPETQEFQTPDIEESTEVVEKHAKSPKKDEEPTPETTISGIVIDEWGSPVPNANVTILVDPVKSSDKTDFSSMQNTLEGQAIKIIRTTSNDAGRFSITQEFDESFAIVVADTENAESSSHEIKIEPGEAISDIEITLKTGTLLVGQIISKDGQPVSGAHVSRTTFLTTAGVEHCCTTGNAISGENGIFRLVFYTTGMTGLGVSTDKGDGYFYNVPVGSPDVIPLTLSATGSLSGTILNSDGSPANGVRIALSVNYDVTSQSVKTSSQHSVEGVETKSDGSYEILNLPSGVNYIATIFGPRNDKVYSPRLSPSINLGMLAEGESKYWDYTITDNIILRGTVLGVPSGEPLGNIRVTLDPTLHLGTSTEADGSFYLSIPLEPNSYEIWPGFPEMLSSTSRHLFSVRTTLNYGDSNTIELTIPDPATIRFRVIDAQGNPIEHASIVPHNFIGDGMSSTATNFQTDAEGLFEWSRMTPEVETRFKVTLFGFSPHRSIPYKAEPGEVIRDEVITLYRTAGVEGYALDEQGLPIASTALIATMLIPGEGQQHFAVSTDESGYFLSKNEFPATSFNLRIAKYDSSLNTSKPMIFLQGRIENNEPDTVWQGIVENFEPGTITFLGEIQLK